VHALVRAKVALDHLDVPPERGEVPAAAGREVVEHANVVPALEQRRDEGVRRVICASSSSVYGANPALPKHEDMAALPISPYATAKLAGEGYCRSFGVGYGLETVALRYFNVFGPRQDPTSQYAAVIPNFITALLEDRPVTIFGDGEQSRDFTHVDNVVQANLLALAAPDVSGKVYNVACGRKVSLNELVAELQELIGTEAETIYAAPRPGEVLHSLACLDRARAELGYEPAVDLREGLTRTIEHYREQRAASALPLA
jgi:UDP-glucose 4-epimerase